MKWCAECMYCLMRHERCIKVWKSRNSKRLGQRQWNMHNAFNVRGREIFIFFQSFIILYTKHLGKSMHQFFMWYLISTPKFRLHCIWLIIPLVTNCLQTVALTSGRYKRCLADNIACWTRFYMIHERHFNNKFRRSTQIRSWRGLTT